MTNKIKENARRIGLVALPVAVSMVTAIPAYAAEGDVDITGTLTTAFTSVKSDMLGTIAAALPIALAVVGAVMAVKFGIKFFRQIAK
ncbi:hypothetical protein RZO55_22890 [Clostridium boliviensis]|uniref:Phage coat protein n=1 Tax=Clostridium boliviensis TaxID=318465 RepID=A0ABU4GS68_9CLOT|nr:hypothetical protein [Clostridium boliviensis]MDW2800419.1 hypothetical protein [Clostridium boliviensis]